MICGRCKQRFSSSSVKLGLCKACRKDNNSLILLRQEVIACTKCDLHKTATNKVFGKGYWAAPILFIGEGPGVAENNTGQPFVGAAGKMLDALIAYAGLPPSSYYITNVLRCHAPGNRVPLPDEVSACLPFLERTIEYIKPKILVPLGLTAARHILELYKVDITEKAMGEIRGNPYYHNGLKIFPMYHPAAILYNKTLMDTAKEDFDMLETLYRGII